MARSVKTSLILLFSSLLLFLAAGATACRNRFEIIYDGKSVRARLHESEVIVPAQIERVDKVAVFTARRMTGDSGLANLKIEAENFKYEHRAKVFYIFGRDLLGNLLTGDLSRFRRSFGDWVLDTEPPARRDLDVKAFAGSFKLEGLIYGRGYLGIVLDTPQGELRLSTSDGTIDNTLHLHFGNQNAGAYSVERRTTNLVRIANSFLEVLALGAFIAFLLSLVISNEIRMNETAELKQGRSYSVLFRKPALIALLVVHFLLCLFVGHFVLGATPHIPDSCEYYRMALLLSDGMLFIPNFDFEPLAPIIPNGGRLRDGNLYFTYNHFWPAILSVANFFGIINFTVYLLSVTQLWVAYRLTSRLENERAAMIAVSSFALSPFTILMGSDYLTHTATTCFLLGGLLALSNHQTRGWTFFAGILHGYAFGIRQLTTGAFLLPIGVYLTVRHFQQVRRFIVPYTLGFGLLVVVSLLDNRIITGSFFVFPHQAYHGLSFGWSNLSDGLNNSDTMLAALKPILFNSIHPALVPALGATTLFLLRGRTILYAAPLVSLLIFYSFTTANGLHGYGPRFLFEGTFGVFLLVGVLFDRLLQRGIVVRAAGCTAFMALLTYNVWMSVPILRTYHHYNGIESAVLADIRQMDLNHSIFLVPKVQWQSLDLGVTLYDPEYESTVFLRALEDRSHEALYKRFPDRRIYLIENGRVQDLRQISTARGPERIPGMPR